MTSLGRLEMNRSANEASNWKAVISPTGPERSAGLRGVSILALTRSLQQVGASTFTAGTRKQQKNPSRRCSPHQVGKAKAAAPVLCAGNQPVSFAGLCCFYLLLGETWVG